MPATIAMQTRTTTATDTAVGHRPSTASAWPAVPVASRYDVGPLHAETTSSAPNAHEGRPRPLVDIVPSLQRAPGRRVAVAFVALPRAIGERRGKRPALRLDVGD